MNDRRTPRASGERPWDLAYALVAIGAAAIGIVLCRPAWPGRVQLALAALGSLSLAASCFTCAWRSAPRLATLNVLIAASGAQALWILLIAISGGATTLVGSSFGVDLATAPLRTTVPLCIPCAVGVLFCLLLPRSVARGGAPLPADADAVSRPLNLLALLGGALMILFWIGGSAEKQGIWYWLRLAHYSLSMVPLLVGRFVTGPAAVFWWCCATANVVVSLSAGARLPALMPVVLWGAGRLWRRGAIDRREMLRFAGAATALVLVSGAIGVARDVAGRSEVRELTGEGLRTIWAEVATALSRSLTSEEFVRAGIGRMLTEPNQAVFVLTPSVVPYRGFGGFADELVRTARLFHLTNRTRSDFLGEGLGASQATAYGFIVNEFTSVEFPMLADGWSRAGVPAAVVMSTLCVLWLVILERLARGWSHRNPTVALVLFIVAVKFALDVGGVSFQAALRTSIYYGAVLVAIAAILSRRTVRNDRPVRLRISVGSLESTSRSRVQ